MTRFKHFRRDLTRFEFALTMVLLIVFVGITIHKINGLEAAAEHANFTATVNRLKSAVMLEALTHVVRDDQAALAELDRRNPMDLMAHPPLNYGGEVDTVAGLESGAWYYDRSEKHLVYVFYRAPRAPAGSGADDHRRFRVRMLYADRDDDGAFAPGIDAFNGVTLELVPSGAEEAASRRAG